ncbi:MAG: hypothetical protein IT384_22685 [Deltaproteobacteria bacterium]|nr:hypothetical protein [Deltaproteobacteria bacterium]
MNRLLPVRTLARVFLPALLPAFLLAASCRDAAPLSVDSGEACPSGSCHPDAGVATALDATTRDEDAATRDEDDAAADDAASEPLTDGGVADPTACLGGEAVTSTVGNAVFTGSLFHVLDWYTRSTCGGMLGGEAIYPWRVPADGVYRFSGSVHVTYLCCNNPPVESDDWMQMTVLSGLDCRSGDAVACGSRDGAVARLASGEDVRVVATSQYTRINRDCSLNDCLLAADFSISITECVPTCSSSRPCGDDGCLGSCGTCAANERCESGTCQ